LPAAPLLPRRQTDRARARRRQPAPLGARGAPGETMKSRLAEKFGLRIPLFAFTSSREVCVEVSRAGGMGVLGAVAYSAAELAEPLDWIDKHFEGRPYGVDVVMPVSSAAAHGPVDKATLQAMISDKHKQFIEEVLRRFDVPPLPDGVRPYEDLLSWV